MQSLNDRLSSQKRLEIDARRVTCSSNRYGFTFADILLDVDIFKATNDEFGHTAESIVIRADKALYAAKQQGKNRIVRAA